MTDDTAAIDGARDDPSRVVLEGLHPLKHALRFGAIVEAVVVEEGYDLAADAAALAPDLPGRLTVDVTPVTGSTFARLCRRRPPAPVLAVARRPSPDVGSAMEAEGRVVLLEDPVHLGNVGAVVRVCAAAGVGAVLTTGRTDPWHPAALRGSAGLHFALPVVGVERLPVGPRPVVAFDPAGEPLGSAALPRHAVLAFGTERAGLSDGLLERADRVVAIPMRDGVSSLNLATSVAVAVYHRLGADG